MKLFIPKKNEEGRYAVFKVKKDSSCLLLTGGMGCGAESLEIYFKNSDILKLFSWSKSLNFQEVIWTIEEEGKADYK